MKRSEIVIDPINFEDATQKVNKQFTTKIHLLDNGKKEYPDEETGIMYHKYSGFAPAKWNPPEKRDFIKVIIDPEQKSCLELEQRINDYDDALADQTQRIFGKYAKLYTIVRSIKEPKDEDELEKEANVDKVSENKQKSVRFKMDMKWSYYYNGEPLDFKNGQLVRKAVNECLAKNKDKNFLPALSFSLTITDEITGKQIKKLVKFDELESRKEISTKVFYRKATSNYNAETDGELSKLTEDKIVEKFGEPELQDVKSPEDLDKYYRGNCYIRFLYAPLKVWAAKNKDNVGIRQCSIQFVCRQMDIIHIPLNLNGQNLVRNTYSDYAFGRKNNSIFTKAEDNIDKKFKEVKKSLKIESDEDEDDEEEEQIEDANDEEDEEESESESEPEPEPPKKSKSKTVIETTNSSSKSKVVSKR